MESFEELLLPVKPALERYVHYRLPGHADAEDVLQEVCTLAYRRLHQLKDPRAFKPWLLRIACNQCNDFYRKRGTQLTLSLDALGDTAQAPDRWGLEETVHETIGQLSRQDQQLLHLAYWQQLSMQEIARLTGVAEGTVKSRLHAARRRFRSHYPIPPAKGENMMKKLPSVLPSYTITPIDEEPFCVKWEELMGWFLIPRLGEKLSWGMYDMPSRRMTHVYDMQVTGKARVHGIDGVELTARESSQSDKTDVIHRTFVAQLTDTHCRYLATLRNDGDVRNYITFLDEDAFMPNWGFGENNCGNETNLRRKGDIQRTGNTVTSLKKPFLLDIVGRYRVDIGSKSYDTVCVMDIETYNSGVVSEQFLDSNGKTILWRRFNRNDWALDRYGAPWSEQLPDNDRLMVNGALYVQWYDCITDYIL